VINSNGFIVSPGEVKKDMTSYPDVADVSVLGVKHEKLEQAVKAVVQIKPGASIAGNELQELYK